MPEAEGGDLEGARRPAAPTRREALAGLRRELEDAGLESPAVEAERLVAHALGLRRGDLASAGDRPLTPGEAGRMARLAARRLEGEPLQHIEGTIEFRELVLVADGRALLPRPETEQLVERVASWARERGRPGGPSPDGGHARGGVVRPRRRGGRVRPPLDLALDVGTGSGAIALSLVAEGVARRAVGLDVSAEALSQAAENRARAGLEEAKVELRLAGRPVWTAVRPEERFDAIVSNPPYVTEEELEALPVEVRDHEPAVALSGGPDGLEVIREVVAGAPSYLAADGALFLEIGAGQGDAVRQLLEADGRWTRVEVARDLAGRERFVRAEARSAPDPAPRRS